MRGGCLVLRQPVQNVHSLACLLARLETHSRTRARSCTQPPSHPTTYMSWHDVAQVVVLDHNLKPLWEYDAREKFPTHAHIKEVRDV